MSFHELAKVGTLARTRDAGFVDDEGRAPQLRAVVLFRVLQEITQSRRIRKALFAEHLGRRRRGRTSEDGALKTLQPTLHLLQSRCFPGARDSPQGADAIGGLEQCGNRLALVGRELRVRRKARDAERRAGVPSGVDDFDRGQFLAEALAGDVRRVQTGDVGARRD